MAARIQCKVVFLDVGGTLITPWPSVGHVYAEVGARCGYPRLDPDALNQRFVTAWNRRNRFDYSRESWSEIFRECVGGSVATKDFEPFFQCAFAEFENPAAWKLYDDVVPCLEDLLEMGIRLGVVSNFDERLVPLLRGFELSRYFEVIVASGPLGLHKPSPGIFQHACRKMGVFPEDCVHVGDRRDEDVGGANAAGMVGWLLTRAGNGGEGTLGSLRELPGKVTEFRPNPRNKLQ